MTPFLSIIIPAYNEADSIGAATRRTIEYFSRRDFGFEVLVVDDGSRDKTAEIVRNLQNDFPTLVLLQNEKNQGKGYSVRRGALEARGEWILFLDADLSTDPEEFVKFEPYLNEYDIIIGSRAVPGAEIIKRQAFLREFAGKFANKLIRLVLNLSYHDTQCGFKAFHRKTLVIFKEQKLRGWLFDAELLFLAQKKGFKAKEVGIRWRNDPSTTVRKRDFLKLLNELCNIRKLHP